MRAVFDRNVHGRSIARAGELRIDLVPRNGAGRDAWLPRQPEDLPPLALPLAKLRGERLVDRRRVEPDDHRARRAASEFAFEIGGQRPQRAAGLVAIEPLITFRDEPLGQRRLARALAILAEASGGYDRPRMSELLSSVGERCRAEGLTPPSRATVYKLLATLPTPRYRAADLPPSVREALYNLTDDSEVPAHQLAFYCFNYGDLAAVSFAAGLPWLALYQAGRVPGFRPRSRGLFEAVMRARGLA